MSHCPPDHMEYLSQMLADNAVTLHSFTHPGCTGIRAFECGDHWHIGHEDWRNKRDCPPTIRPYYPHR